VNSSRRKSRSLLPLAFVGLVWGALSFKAQPATPVAFPIPITPSGGSYSAPPSTGPLLKARGDYVIWTNNSEADMHICMEDTSNQRAFQNTSFFAARSGGTASSGPVQPNALGGGHNYLWDFYKDNGGSAGDRCPAPHGKHRRRGRIGPKTIVVQ
jgi:hypothetical protein